MSLGCLPPRYARGRDDGDYARGGSVGANNYSPMHPVGICIHQPHRLKKAVRIVVVVI